MNAGFRGVANINFNHAVKFRSRIADRGRGKLFLRAGRSGVVGPGSVEGLTATAFSLQSPPEHVSSRSRPILPG